MIIFESLGWKKKRQKIEENEKMIKGMNSAKIPNYSSNLNSSDFVQNKYAN